MTKYRDVEVLVYGHGTASQKNPEKKTYTVLFDGSQTSDNDSIEAFLYRVYGWKKGLHYDRFEILTIKEHKSMAKKKQEIEDAQVIEETINEVVDQEVQEAEEVKEPAETTDTKFDAKMPAIPSVFIVNGQEHSLSAVSGLEKEANDLLKKATPDTYEDDKFWELVNRKRLDARDQRTKLEAQRKKLIKPVNDVLSSLKKKTDEIGEAAKKVEDKLQEAITKKENWEQEQERIRLEEIRKRTEKRKEQLRDLGGKYSYETDSFSFEHDPSLFINSTQINDMTEQEFEEEVKFVEESFLAQKEKERQEKIAADNAQKEGEKAKKELVELRRMILESGGYEEDEHGFHKNGWTITMSEVETLPNNEFIPLTAKHNTPVESAPSEPVISDLPAIDIPEAPVSDPLGDVVSGMVEDHKEHQSVVDGVKEVVITFTKENPYIDVRMGKSILRLAHIDYEEVSLSNIDADKEVIAKNYIGDELILTAIGTPKKK